MVADDHFIRENESVRCENALLACPRHTEPNGFTILMDEYADDVNRAYDDVHGLTSCVYDCANVFEQIRLHCHVHDAHHCERVHVRESSFREHGRVHVLHSLKIAFH